jgi:hypothetical protein
MIAARDDEVAESKPRKARKENIGKGEEEASISAGLLPANIIR